MQKTILVIGMFSIYESFLQRGMEWGSWAFDELERHLKQCGENNLAQEFSDYRLAINVLKHGKGPSYERLLKRLPKLNFNLKLQEEAFFSEGDVSEVTSVLIDIDDNFVSRCAAVIEETMAQLPTPLAVRQLL